MNGVRFYLIDLHRLEGAIADVQGNGRALDTFLLQAIEKLLGEMESGGRRRDRAALAGIHGLIPIAIALRVVPLDIRRQRHVADVLDRLFDARAVLRPEPYRPPAMEVPLENFAMKHVTHASKYHLRSRPKLLAGMDERVPALYPLVVEVGPGAGIRRPRRSARARREGGPGRPSCR